MGLQSVFVETGLPGLLLKTLLSRKNPEDRKRLVQALHHVTHDKKSFRMLCGDSNFPRILVLLEKGAKQVRTHRCCLTRYQRKLCMPLVGQWHYHFGCLTVQAGNYPLIRHKNVIPHGTGSSLVQDFSQCLRRCCTTGATEADEISWCQALHARNVK